MSSSYSNIALYYVDHLAIRQLIDRYTDVVNNRSWQQLPDIFAREAVWEAGRPINMKFEGIAAVIKGIPESVEKMELLVQQASGVIISVGDDNKAQVRSYLTEFGRLRENGKGMHAKGMYQDVVMKEQGEWKFLSRTFILTYFDELPVPGNTNF